MKVLQTIVTAISVPEDTWAYALFFRMFMLKFYRWELFYTIDIYLGLL